MLNIVLEIRIQQLLINILKTRIFSILITFFNRSSFGEFKSKITYTELVKI